MPRRGPEVVVDRLPYEDRPVPLDLNVDVVALNALPARLRERRVGEDEGTGDQDDRGSGECEAAGSAAVPQGSASARRCMFLAMNRMSDGSISPWPSTD